ncbi:MAG: 4-hydroxy-tetrahydrodipicolinate reductase [Clostridiales bacterium]|nr:4-hydroxy-tetrahydrodipicolinate reductase [Clostridiales bacterium]
MLRIILRGCSGKMGRVVTEVAALHEDLRIVSGVDVFDNVSRPYPIFTSFAEVPVEADVIVDFSNPSNIEDMLNFAVLKQMPLVIASTGFSDELIEVISKAAEKTPVFMATNMSIGINLLAQLAKTAAKVLGTSFDIEIVEAHHNQKLDAPSGTAKTLAKAVEDGLDFEPLYVYDRHDKREKRGKTEIGMHAIRGGTIVGEHEIIFAGNDEVIKLSHSALSKNIFAEGALNAARYIVKKQPGLYSMQDLVSESN